MSSRPFYKGHIRGLYPEEINEPLMQQIALHIATHFPEIKAVACGYDSRSSSPALHKSFTETLLSQGIKVCHLGCVPSELVYFSSFHPDIDAAFMITASHNPKGYNGLKALKHSGIPFEDSSLKPTANLSIEPTDAMGSVFSLDFELSYLDKIKLITAELKLPQLNILANACNGTAALLSEPLFEHFKLKVDWVNKAPNGDFPDCGPNPSQAHYQAEMKQHMQSRTYDLGIAWDGDADRCLLYDHLGNLVDPAICMGLIAKSLIQSQANKQIIYEHKISWALHLNLSQHDWQGFKCQTGHVNMKRAMQKHDAIYGGEVSGHHYFGAMNSCDNGNLPWIYILALLESSQRSLADLAHDFAKHAPSLPEISVRVKHPILAMRIIEQHFVPSSLQHDFFDGLSCEFETWRFNLRQSHTEPCLRLNLESKPEEPNLLDRKKAIFELLKDEITP